MDYSFRQFVEQNYMNQLIEAANSYIQSDNRCDIEVTVKYIFSERSTNLKIC